MLYVVNLKVDRNRERAKKESWRGLTRVDVEESSFLQRCNRQPRHLIMERCALELYSSSWMEARASRNRSAGGPGKEWQGTADRTPRAQRKDSDTHTR